MAAIAGPSCGSRRDGTGSTRSASMRRCTGSATAVAWRQFTLARHRSARSGRTRVSCQSVRGRRVCALGGSTPADRGRMGDRRGARPIDGPFRRGSAMLCPRARGHRRRRADATLRRRVGVDAKRVFAVSRLSTRAGRRRRIQRQVHVATSTCCAAARSPHRDRISAPPTAISSRRRRAGSSRASGWRAMPESASTSAAFLPTV